VPYRLLVFVQITGALFVAAGIPAMLEARAPNASIVVGYVVMRLALVVQWLRAGASDPPRRTTARRYALGITVAQTLWVGVLFVPQSWMLPVFLGLAVLDISVPLWAERASPTTWHPHHIAERYGLLTLIVLGESVLSANAAIQSALAAGAAFSRLIPLIVGGLLIMYSMWWSYFDRPVHDLLTGLRKAFVWGYGHYFVFASAAAVGAGLAVAVDAATHEAKIGPVGAGAAVAVPVATYLLCLWVLHDRPDYRQTRAFGPIAAVLVLLTPFTGYGVPLTGVILASLVGVKLFIYRTQVHGATR